MEETMKNNTSSEDKFLNELERKILQVIVMYNRPVTIDEVSYELAISKHIANRHFSSLLKKGNLIELLPSNSRKKYYAAANSKEAIEQSLAQKYVDLIAPLEKKYEEIKVEQEKISEQLNGVYFQIITLMGIFVAIFALIIINVNAIGEFANEASNLLEVCKALAILNIPLVISLTILTALIKWIIKPSNKKK